jgi:SAM-dependent methyltransferase
MAEYAFVDDKPERLAGIEATWDPGTVERLERLGVGSGWNCLEVGAGGGSIAAWMAKRVGKNGRVLATDVDTTFLTPLAGDNVEVRRHDLLTDELPADTFDVVHARLLLEWLGESDALERLVKATAPGGWVLVEDFDWAIGGPADDSPVLAKALDAILGLLQGIGYQRFLGRSLPRRFEQVGLTEIGNDARAYVFHGGTPGAAFYRFSFESQRERLLESGLLTTDEIDETLLTLDDPEQHLATAMMFAAWGRKPA